MENIVWKDVPIEEFKNSYEVSNTGEIRNKKTLKIKATQFGSTGYITTRLDVGSCKKTIQLHSIIAQAFLKPIEEKENKKIIVKFKDENKNNINSNNLFYDYQNITKSTKIKIVDDINDNHINNNLHIDNEITINDFKGKIILDYPDYLISKDGQVYSKKTKKVKVPEINQTGYCRIELCINNTKKKFYIHQLVAKAYIPNPNNYDQVNHKDLNKHNNNVDNLEWCDGSMNMKHNADNKPENSRKVIQLDPLDTNKIIGTFNSIKEASIKTGINNTSIIHCCSKKYKKAGGYVWSYTN
jgi:hypothetical protein